MYYVYYLLDPTTGNILYIGRSSNPRSRHVAFSRRTGITTVQGLMQRYSDFTASCFAEHFAIAKHKPPFNKIPISSTGFLNQRHPEEAKEPISKKNKGHPTPPEMRAKISAALLGRPPTKGMTGKKHKPETIQLLRGKAISEETRKRMSISAKNRRKKNAATSTFSL